MEGDTGWTANTDWDWIDLWD